MSPDTLTVRVVNEAEIDADTADLTVVVEGSSVFFSRRDPATASAPLMASP